MEKKDRFSLRKLKSGVVSVALGSLLVVAGTVTAEAAGGDGEGAGDGQIEEILVEENPEDETQSTEADDLIVEVDTGETQEVVVSEPVVERHDGLNREEVAINVAEKHFIDAEKAIIVNQDTYTDAISATNISRGEYPVLYTRADKLGDKTLASLGKMENLREIYLLGGTTSINDSVKDRLTDEFGDIVKRIDGLDRFEANANAIREGYTEEEEMKADHVVIATGEIYTDALYGVSYANTINAPIILSKTDRLVQESLDLIKELGATQVTIIGGESSVTNAVKQQLTALNIDLENINRIAGANRYDGSALVAENAYKTPETVLIASGDIFTDALVSAPLAQKLGAPIILVRKDSTVDEVKAYLKEVAPTVKNIYIQGGTSTINKANENEIKDLATHKTDEAVIITAYLTLQATDKNTVVATFISEDEEYNATETIELDEALVDGVEQDITFTHSGREYTATALYVTAGTFVEKIDGLKWTNEIKGMNAKELAEERIKIEEARSFYNALTDTAKADDTVIEKEKALSPKEKALEEREEELEAKELEAVENFVEAVKKLPSLDKIENMVATDFEGLENAIKEAENLYGALTEEAKADNTVIKKVEALGLTEKALEERKEELATKKALEDK